MSLKINPGFSSSASIAALQESVRDQNPLQKFTVTLGALKDDPQLAKEEYEAMHAILDKEPYTTALQTTIYNTVENTPKNRPCGIYPYDNNRVTTDGSKYNTHPIPYINASKITVSASSLEFIATQAPLEETVVDLFNMMIEEEVSAIVSLVMPKEPKKISDTEVIWKDRCAPYWSQKTDLKNGYHLHEAKVISTSTFSDTEEMIVKRELEITRNGSPFKKVVQYHYENWPDHGVPNIMAFDDFMGYFGQEIIDQNQSIVGHCHAGSGRTGVFFACLFAMDTIQKQMALGKKIEEIEINIPQIVFDMKLCRKMITNNEGQYIFVRSWIAHYVERLIQFTK